MFNSSKKNDKHFYLMLSKKRDIGLNYMKCTGGDLLRKAIFKPFSLNTHV